MQTPRIIAICGFKRSGKDTLADYLCNHHGYTKVKISTPLKEGLKSFFNFNDEQLECSSKDEIDPRWGITPRCVMQYFGTEVMQYQLQNMIPGIGRNFWIQRLVNEFLQDKSKKYVIPDMRFMHEYKVLNDYDTTFWRVERTSLLNAQQETELHISEKEYMEIPVSHIFNNKDNQKHLFYEEIEYYISFNKKYNL
jgi:hypothetical protein